MTQAFSVARDAVLAVDTAWANLEFILKDAESQILLGQNLAESLNQAYCSELVQARKVIASVQGRIEQDPL
ncbi:MAG: hypothetical protein V7K48_07425 [Nostoc sp.]|uniref:hypothetical protein n=1 Tax=Nostoc sp. TaxID=1180 RepID=UPI002FF4E6F9